MGTQAMTTTPSDDRIQALEEAIADLQRSRPLACYDCGRRYVKGPDLVVPDADWAKIAPHDGQGVLCPNCMHDRFVALGVPDGSVRARFKSGPFVEDIFDAGLAAGRAELQPKLEQAEANYRFMVERAADQKLDGYRELGQMACDSETRALAAEQKLAALVEGLRRISENLRRPLTTERPLRPYDIAEDLEALLSAAPGEAK